jgi:hypothetical protein
MIKPVGAFARAIIGDRRQAPSPDVWLDLTEGLPVLTAC